MSTHNTFQPGLLRDKAVFITGSGSGINRQIAQIYAIAGAAVTIAGRNEEMARHGGAGIEASELALYPASASGRYINGVVIPIDGGFSAADPLEFGRIVKELVKNAAHAVARHLHKLGDHDEQHPQRRVADH